MSNAKMPMRNVLYLPSTPLNLLLSLAHAYASKHTQKSSLILIDQKPLQGRTYFDALKSLQNSPFETIDILFGQAKGWQKMSERKANFSKLKHSLSTFLPDAIAVGSDRRVEFQYLMHCLNQSGKKIEGWYLDDGLYSYAGRPYQWLKDEVTKQIKKIVYGGWWREPKTVGASSWITQAWLFQPDQAVSELREKHCLHLLADWFLNQNVLSFSAQVCRAFGLGQMELDGLKELDVFLLIPHPNNIKKMDGYESRLRHFLLALKQQGFNVGAKYHPRTEGDDPLGLIKKYDVLLIPSGVAFEFILPFFKKQTSIIGDVGTALLTAQWLRPDVKVIAVLEKKDEFQQRFIQIYHQLGVKQIDSFQDVQFEKNSPLFLKEVSCEKH